MEATAKQSIVERIKGATNILVTVSRDPSVDELSAALALTLMLNKMDKHATAVVSGKVPSALEFLEPNKTFENTVDSLRDFIIALDKEKADRLRYKVEDDVVRIFITPYRTTISEKDLNFSQGDFNVELVIALGVEKKEDLDTAIAAHGRILHDATVVSINSDGAKSSLGSIDWTDANVSSLCEMLMSLSEALQSGLLDEQIASALLTGLVAATERFSNTHTSPRVMTMAAQLMAAGANQQLIAAKLEEGHALPSVSEVAPDGSKQLKEDASQKLAPDETPAKKADGEMQIEHEEPHAPEVKDTPAEQELSSRIAVPVAPTLSVDDLRKDLDEAAKDLHAAASETSQPEPTDQKSTTDWRNREIEPTFGGTLSATADDAEEEKRREELSSQNHKILTHDAPAATGQGFSVPAYAQDEPPSVDPFAEPPKSDPDAPLHYEPTPIKTITPLEQPEAPKEISAEPAPTLAELESEVRMQADPVADAAASLDDARAAVDAALSSLPGATPIEPQQPAAYAPEPPVVSEQPAQQTSAPLPPLPPLPDFSTLPPLPTDPTPSQQPPADVPPQAPPHFDQPLESPLPPAAPDPGQFKIPGQQ